MLQLDRMPRGAPPTPLPEPPPPPSGGSEGNRRLTGSTAAALLVLLAAEGTTILAIRPLLSVHVFIGMALLPVVGLKLGSTGYRFFRYYTGTREYRAAGPPKPLLRLLGPVVVVATLTLFASGVALVVASPSRGPVLALHKASFIVWFGAMAAHVIGHLVRTPKLAAADWRQSDRLPGSSTRRWLLAGAIVLGLVLGLATFHLAAAWHGFHHFHDG